MKLKLVICLVLNKVMLVLSGCPGLLGKGPVRMTIASRWESVFSPGSFSPVGLFQREE